MITIPRPTERHILQPDCWCGPAVKRVEGGHLVFHNDAVGLALGLHPVRVGPREQ